MSNNTSVLGGGNLNLSKTGLASGGTTTLTTAALTICILGKLYSVAAGAAAPATTTDGLTGAAFAPVPVGRTQVFVVGYTALGARKVCAGASALAGMAPEFPNMPDEICAVGYVVVSVGVGGAPFTWGASNLVGLTGVTYSFQDVCYLPAKPQLS